MSLPRVFEDVVTNLSNRGPRVGICYRGVPTGIPGEPPNGDSSVGMLGNGIAEAEPAFISEVEQPLRNRDIGTRVTQAAARLIVGLAEQDVFESAHVLHYGFAARSDRAGRGTV